MQRAPGVRRGPVVIQAVGTGRRSIRSVGFHPSVLAVKSRLEMTVRSPSPHSSRCRDTHRLPLREMWPRFGVE